MIPFEKFRSIVVVIICYLYAFLYIYAASAKIIDFENFRNQLGQSPLLNAFAGWVAILVPVLEFLIAIALFTVRFRFIGLLSAFMLMVMFSAYIYIILNYSAFIPCSCGGILEKMNWDQHFIFNVVFVVLGAIAILIMPSGQIINSNKAMS